MQILENLSVDCVLFIHMYPLITTDVLVQKHQTSQASKVDGRIVQELLQKTHKLEYVLDLINELPHMPPECINELKGLEYS